MWIVLEPNWEYDDEHYFVQGSATPHLYYKTEEEAEEARKAKIKEFKKSVFGRNSYGSFRGDSSHDDYPDFNEDDWQVVELSLG